MREIDELRPLTAGRLLALWREVREVLAALTGRQLERLLLRLAEAEPGPEGTGNPSFDQGRFEALREG